jgi:FkbM family methyltransferase
MATCFFKTLYPKAEVLCFEPAPDSFELLIKNVEINSLSAVSVFNVALWNREEEVSLFLEDVQPGSLMASTDRSRVVGREIQVPGKRLSSYITRPIDFLKLDIEGAEEHVLDDLIESGKVAQIVQGVIEYHHKIPGHPSRLSTFLKKLEDSGFEYQLEAKFWPITERNQFQDVTIVIYR